jgi:phospho-N-acetylmuramoyl-pentapeptide-transferase
MFLLFYDWLKDVIPGANVLRYVSFRILMATLTTLVTSMVLLPEFIRRLREKKLGQSIREVGPKTHQVKAGTPTMGGTVILIAAAVSILLWADLANPMILMLLFILLSFGAVGFVDDYLKLKYANSKGLPGRYKLLFQFLSAGIVMAVFLTWYDARFGFDHRLYIPFLRSDRYWIELPEWLYFLFALVVIVGTSNAVNLTDGLDGLAIGPSLVALSTFLVLAYVSSAKLGNFDISRYLLIPHVNEGSELAVLCAALIGGAVGFLWYNAYPAQVFLGDVGALAIGGVLGLLAIFIKSELLSVIIFGIFLLEAISVIVQTTSYKLTGKRVFKMAPIHHHFELKGWHESTITVRFWIVSILLAIIALASIKLR